MAGMVYGNADAEYHGLAEIFAFINDDGELCYRNCGQAAAATLLTYQGAFKTTPERAMVLMRAIENAHPPDNLFGWFGSSRRCVTRICRAHGIELTAVEGEDAFRA